MVTAKLADTRDLNKTRERILPGQRLGLDGAMVEYLNRKKEMQSPSPSSKTNNFFLKY